MNLFHLDRSDPMLPACQQKRSDDPCIIVTKCQLPAMIANAGERHNAA